VSPRVRRPRPAVRRLVALAGVAAFCVAAVAAVGRVAVRREWAGHHAARLEEARRWEADWRRRGGRAAPRDPGPEGAEAVQARLRRAIRFHEAMRRKWEGASFRPWEPVAADPPGPK
jgi:hypothetical protein